MNMNKIALEVSQLSKEYKIGSIKKPYRNVREMITDAARLPFKKLMNIVQGQGSGAEDT